MSASTPSGEPVSWFRCRPAAILDRISGLMPHESLVYLTLLFRVHDEAEPVSETTKSLARHTGLRRGLVANALTVLIEAGIVQLTVDGRLDLPEAQDEIAWRHTLAARRQNGPSETGRRVPPNWQAIRLAIFARDGFVCAYCESSEGPFEVDHIEAYARGGSHEPENLCVACVPCNRGKSDRSADEWRSILAARAADSERPHGGAV